MTLKALLLVFDYDSTLHIKQILGVKHQTSYLVIKLGSLRRGIDD